MPVRYDIAAQVPQVSAGPDIMNMMAQYQAMGYRQQQNALAQMQMDEYQRKMQAEQARAGLFAKPGFNPLSQQGLLDIARVDPEYFRQFISPYASYTSGMASAQASGAGTRLAEREFEEIKRPHAALETDKLILEKEEAGLRGRKLQQEIRKLEEIEMPKAFSDLEKARNDQKISNQDYLTKKSEYYRDYFKNFVTNQTTLDRLVDLMDQDKDFPAGGAAFRGVQFTPEWKSSQLISPEKQAEMARPEFEYRQVTTPTGRSQIVAIPKRSPQAGAIPVPGTEGVELPNYSFSQGPAGTGTMFAGDPKTGGGYLFTPSQPGVMPQNAMAPPPLLPQTSFTNAPPVQLTPSQGMLAPRARAASIESVGGATAPLGSSERGRQDVMQQILTAGAYNPDTGVDLIEPTLGRASSGMLSATGTDIARKFGKDSAAARADTDLKRISADLTQAFSGNRLATAGVAAAEADRFEKQAGDIGNSNLTIGERLNAYRSIKRNATRLLGVEYKNPFDPQGIKVEGIMRQRVEATPEGEFKVTDPEGGVHVFGERKKAAEFLTYMQRMLVGKR